MVAEAGKVMTFVFWDAKGILMIDYLWTSWTINREYYANLLRQLQREIKSKQPGMLTKSVLFLQDNAPVQGLWLQRLLFVIVGLNWLLKPQFF